VSPGRSSAGPRTPHQRTGTPDLRPRPPDSRPRPRPTLSRVNPSPPPGVPPTRPSASSSVKALQGPLWARTGDLPPGPSQAALRPAASSTQRVCRKQIAPSPLSVDPRNNTKGVENNVSLLSDNENSETRGAQRERNTDLNVFSMTENRGTTKSCNTITVSYNTMNHHLVSATEASHTQNASDDNRRSIVGSVTCPIRGVNRGQTGHAVFLTAPFQPLPPSVPKLTTGERHSVRHFSLRQDHNLFRGRKDTLHTVNT